MDLKIKKINEYDLNSWNNLISKLEGPLHNCTWNNLEYYSSYNGIKNTTFAIFYENKLIAVFPFAKNSTQKNKFSFGNNSVFAPLFKPNITSSFKKRLYKQVFQMIKKKFRLKKLQMNIEVSPIYFENNKSHILSKNQFYLLEFSKKYIVHNLLVVDLKKEENQLLKNMSKYHRKNINKTSKIKDLRFKVLNHKNSTNEIEKKFYELKKYHRISAGRVTRPLKTWKIMLKKIYDNEADLFFLNLNDKTISFLYCSRWLDFAWGWTQVNLKTYEYLSPRHFLEWNAMKYYKKNDFHFYELGERYSKQDKFNPSKKELSISEFKEKFGSDKYPKSYFHLEV